MTQRTLRHIPLSKIPILEAERAAAELKSLVTNDEIVADMMGIDKTILALFLFINSTVT